MISLRRSKKRRSKLRRPPYADRHIGETLLVLGNGPSLQTHADALHAWIERERPIVLGANHITPFRAPDYHAFTNRKRFVAYARTVDRVASRVLLSPYLPTDLIATHFDGAYEEIAYVADNEHPFDVADGVILTSCRTVSVLLLGVAAVMGAQRIFVAGLDGFSGGDLYFTETEVLAGDEKLHAVDVLTRRYLFEIQAWLAEHGRDPLAILTPTAYSEHHRPELLVA